MIGINSRRMGIDNSLSSLPKSGKSTRNALLYLCVCVILMLADTQSCIKARPLHEPSTGYVQLAQTEKPGEKEPIGRSDDCSCYPVREPCCSRKQVFILRPDGKMTNHKGKVLFDKPLIKYDSSGKPKITDRKGKVLVDKPFIIYDAGGKLLHQR